jgi:hypothetical protein
MFVPEDSVGGFIGNYSTRGGGMSEFGAADHVGLWGFSCYNCREANPFIDRPNVTICEIEAPFDTPETRTYSCKRCGSPNEVTMGRSAWRRLEDLKKKHGA